MTESTNKDVSKGEGLDGQRSKVVNLTPFETEDLKGQRFARGSMLGGGVPVQEAAHDASWEND